MKKFLILLGIMIYHTIISSAQDVSQLLESYYKGFNETYKLAYNDRMPAREKLDAKYVSLMASVIGADEAKEIIYETYIKRVMNSSEAKSLELSAALSREFAILKHECDVAIFNVRKSSLSADEKSFEINALKSNRNENLKKVLGLELYEKWLSYDKGAHKRYYMTFFNFTSEEYSKLMDIENEYAVERMAAVSQGLGYGEEDILIEEAKEKRLKQIKTLLGEEKYQKWYEVYLINEEYKKANGIR